MSERATEVSRAPGGRTATMRDRNIDEPEAHRLLMFWWR